MPSEKQKILAEPSEVSQFYHGKSIFITGAGGFLGMMLLEALLRCCPGILKIYILLRPKKGMQPQERKEYIFKKEIFNKLKEKDPEAPKKVFVVPGDVSKERLGMSEKNWIRVTQEVSIVFHCAAAITFLKPLSFMMNNNVIGTNNIIELCLKIPKLKALIYTSTILSNCNQKTVIEEKTYDMPFTVDEILEASRNWNEEELNRLFTMCCPIYPNQYAFSKGVSEYLIAKKARDLPVSIIRPSVLIGCRKEPIRGYVDEKQAMPSIFIAVGRGILRVVLLDEDKKIETIPTDIAANTHIIAAYRQASENLPSPFVYNCTAGESFPFTLRQFIRPLMDMGLKYPLPDAYQKPSIIICKSVTKFKFFSFLEHHIPAAVIDLALFMSGHKPRFLKFCQLYDKIAEATKFFMTSEWHFERENFKSLSEKLNSTDAETFSVDMKGYSIEECMEGILIGSPAYRKSNKSYKENLKTVKLRFALVSFLKWSILGSIAFVFYMAVF